MGTAVLQPQDCLASRHSCHDCHFLPASECPSSVRRPSRRGSSAHSKASSFTTDCARGGFSGGTILAEGRGLLGRKNSSAGLLPLPDQALRSIHPSFHRSAPNIPSCRFGEIIDPYDSRQFTSFLGSRLGPDGADSCLSRCPSISSLDHQTPTTPRGFSDCSTMLVERSHVSRLRGGNQCVAIAHRNCMLGSWSCVEGVVPSYQKPKPSTNPHQSDVNDAVVSNGANWSNQLKEIISPEFVHLGRQSLKPPCKALPDAQVKPTCKVISTAGRKHGVSRQLKRCMPEKFQERTKMSVVQRPNTKEAARNLITSIFQEVDKYKSSGCPASLVEGKKEGVQGEVSSLDVGHQESCHKFDSSRWLSLNTNEKWAGPSFFNSPAPNALPVPSFTSRLSRVTSICSVPEHKPDCGTQIVLGKSFPEAARSWDVTFATKDLRRMLNLNC